MTVTLVGVRQCLIPPTPVDVNGDQYELLLPAGASVGDLLILHWGVTKSVLYPYVSRMAFHGSSALDPFPITVEGGGSAIATMDDGGGNNLRLIGAAFGLITALTPDPITLVVTSATSDPLHGKDRFGLSAWAGPTQAYIATADDCCGFAGLAPAHTAPHSVSWIAQGGFSGVVTTNLGTNGWDWADALAILFTAADNASFGVSVTSIFETGPAAGDNTFGGDEGSAAWGALTIGLSDQAPDPPPPDPDPEIAHEAAPNSLSFGSFSGGVIESQATSPPPSGGLDAPLHPYHVTKEPR